MLRTSHDISIGPLGLVFSMDAADRILVSRLSSDATWRFRGRRLRTDLQGVDGKRVDKVAASQRQSLQPELLVVEDDGSLVLVVLDPRGFEEFAGEVHVEGVYPLSLGRRRAADLGLRGRNLSSIDWAKYLTVFAGEGGAIYAITRAGSLEYNWIEYAGARPRLRHKSNQVLASGRGPGSGWDQYQHVAASTKGDIFAVRDDGQLVWYRHLGYESGTSGFAGGGLEQEVTGAVFPGTAHLSAGWGERLLVLTESGDLEALKYKRVGDAPVVDTRVVIPHTRDDDWRRFHRVHRYPLVDGSKLQQHAVTYSLRKNERGEVEHRTDLAHTTVGSPQLRSDRFLLQNMQLFPDRILDVFSDTEKALSIALAGGAGGGVLGLAGAGFGLAASVTPFLAPIGAAAAATAPVAGLIALLAGAIDKKLPSPADVAAKLDDANKRLYNGVGRGAQLAELIRWCRETPFTAVCLNEMWVASEAARVARELKAQYPYAAYGPHSEPDPLPSGLLILSRLPITETDATVYRAGIDADAFASKGVLLARLGDEYDLYVTHLQNDNADDLPWVEFGPGSTPFEKQQYQLEALSAFVAATHDPRRTALLMGDFNLDAARGDFLPNADDVQEWQRQGRQGCGAVPSEEYKLLRRKQGQLLDDALADLANPGRQARVAFGDVRAPTDGLKYYKVEQPPVPDSVRDLSLKERRERLCLQYGKTIDNVFHYPGAGRRFDVGPLARLERYVEHQGPVEHQRQTKQLSDHIGVLTPVESSQSIDVKLQRMPTSIRVRPVAVQCFIESVGVIEAFGRDGQDDSIFEFNVRSGTSQGSGSISKRVYKRAQRREITNVQPVELISPGSDLTIQVAGKERDGFTAFFDVSLGSAAKRIPTHCLLGTGPAYDTRRGPGTVEPGTTTSTQWWVGLLRGTGAEYAVEFNVQATW